MNSLKEYGDLFERLGLTELDVEDGSLKIHMKKEAATAVEQPVKITNVTQAAAQENTETEQPVKVAKGDAVKAPLLGIFYGKVGDKEAYKVGDSVKKGDVLCTIEAMKMMNEVKAPKDGVILEVLAEEGALVEFNQELFILG